MTPTEVLADQVLRDHVVRGYDCSCGALINSHDRHLVIAGIEAARKDTDE